eukprot:6456489-Amphidinium_carterae.2
MCQGQRRHRILSASARAACREHLQQLPKKPLLHPHDRCMHSARTSSSHRHNSGDKSHCESKA